MKVESLAQQEDIFSPQSRSNTFPAGKVEEVVLSRTLDYDTPPGPDHDHALDLKHEVVSSDNITGDARHDIYPIETTPARGSQTPTPRLRLDNIVREGRILPRIEVVLPTLQEVRTRKRRAAQQAQNTAREQVANTVNDQTRARSIIVKPEPDEDTKGSLSLPVDFDRHDPPTTRLLQTAIAELRNPDFKVKQEMLLSDSFLLDALTWEGINRRYPIPLPKEIAEHPLRRDYISHLYGGSLQDTFPKPSSENLWWHGLNDFMFISTQFNPHAPMKSGHSGLYFSESDETEEEGKVMRTFVKRATSNWLYMGQYLLEKARPLTSAAWKEQSEKVRRTWAQGLHSKSWGTDICIRVWLRKERGADYDATKEDMKYGTKNIERIRSLLTEQDIKDAYDRGEEEIRIYTMTCVGYDEEIIRVLARNAHRWVPPPKKRAKKGNGQRESEHQAGKGTRPKTRKRGSQRKSVEISESEFEAEAPSPPTLRTKRARMM